MCATVASHELIIIDRDIDLDGTLDVEVKAAVNLGSGESYLMKGLV